MDLYPLLYKKRERGCDGVAIPNDIIGSTLATGKQSLYFGRLDTARHLFLENKVEGGDGTLTFFFGVRFTSNVLQTVWSMETTAPSTPASFIRISADGNIIVRRHTGVTSGTIKEHITLGRVGLSGVSHVVVTMSATQALSVFIDGLEQTLTSRLDTSGGTSTLQPNTRGARQFIGHNPAAFVEDANALPARLDYVGFVDGQVLPDPFFIGRFHPETKQWQRQEPSASLFQQGNSYYLPGEVDTTDDLAAVKRYYNGGHKTYLDNGTPYDNYFFKSNATTNWAYASREIGDDKFLHPNLTDNVSDQPGGIEFLPGGAAISDVPGYFALNNDVITFGLKKDPARGYNSQVYTGNGGVLGLLHGLPKKPRAAIIKNLDENTPWLVWIDGMANNQFMYLNSNNPIATDTGASTYWDPAQIDDTNFTLSVVDADASVNKNGSRYEIQWFADVPGGVRVYETNDGLIPTHAATAWETFEVTGETYVLVTNHYNDVSYNINSKLYKFNKVTQSLVEIQTFATNGALNWETFTVGGVVYALVANFYNGTTRQLDSKLYKFNASTEQFAEIQSIATKGAYDWCVFESAGSVFALVANANDDTSVSINSKLYKFNAGTEQFAEIQSIATDSAYDWETFTVGGVVYALVANNYDGTSYNTNSKLYKFNAGTEQFAEIQSIATHGAEDWEIFTVGADTYAIVANSNNGTSSNIDSKLYKFNAGTEQFAEIQGILTNAVIDWEVFESGGTTYAVVANYRDGSDYTIDSKLYRFDPTAEELVWVQSVATVGAGYWKSFTVDNMVYLLLANYIDGTTRNLDSKLYRFVDGYIDDEPGNLYSRDDSFTVGKNLGNPGRWQIGFGHGHGSRQSLEMDSTANVASSTAWNYDAGAGSNAITVGTGNNYLIIRIPDFTRLKEWGESKYGGNHLTAVNFPSTNNADDNVEANGYPVLSQLQPTVLANNQALVTYGGMGVLGSTGYDTWMVDKPIPKTGKWFFECNITRKDGGGSVGITNDPLLNDSGAANVGSFHQTGPGAFNGTYSNGSVDSHVGTALPHADISFVRVEVDMDAGTLSYWENGLNEVAVINAANFLHSLRRCRIFLQKGHSTGSTGVGMELNFGQRPFLSVPSSDDFLPLSAENIAKQYTITDPSKFVKSFRTTGTDPQITTDFYPDVIMTKTDVNDRPDWRFKAQGFATSYDPASNTVHDFTGVPWTVVNNGDGTYTTTLAGVSSTCAVLALHCTECSGMDVLQWTGDGGQDLQLTQNTGGPVEYYMGKGNSNTMNWYNYYLPDRRNARMNEDSSAYGDGSGAGALMTSDDTTVTLTGGGIGSQTPYVNQAGVEYIALVMRSVPGFLDIQGYRGNNNANGPDVAAGFRPEAMMFCPYDVATSHTMMVAATNPTAEPNNQTERLYLSTAVTWGSNASWGYLHKGGFKITNTGNLYNSATQYLAIAWAQSPGEYA